MIPFKGSPHGKSRLSASGVCPGLDSTQRARLAIAFLQDTVAAAIQIPQVHRVLIVSSAHEIYGVGLLTAQRGGHGAAGVTRVRDPGLGLNAAVSKGVRAARRIAATSFVAVLTSDLPCLASGELAQAFTRASAHDRAMIADHDGVGTTIVTVAPGFELAPRFGGNSRAAHQALGHKLIDLPDESGLRFDVDTIADLQLLASAGMAVGPATTRCIAGFTAEIDGDNRRALTHLTMRHSVVGSSLSSNEPGFRLHNTNQSLED